MADSTATGKLTPWVKSIPSSWAVCRLGAVADVLFSNVDKHTIEDELPVRLCNYLDVYRNSRITDAIDFMEATADPHEIDKFQVKKGDVLVTKDSETPNDIAISALVADELPGVICGYHLSMIRVRSRRITAPFLAWLHASKQFRSQYEAKAVGVTRFGLPQHAFREAVIALPPPTEQLRITAFLEASCTVLDGAIAAKRRQIESLDAIRKAFITEAVTGGLNSGPPRKASDVAGIGPLPTGWKIEKLKYVTSLIVDGTHVTPTYLPEGIPFLRVTDIQTNKIDLGNVKYISEEEHRTLCRRAKAERGDILLSKNGTIGIVKVVDWDWPFSFFVSLCLLRPLRKLNPHYFSYYFESNLVDQQLFESSKRTSVTNLHLVKIRELLIALPPINEQGSICLHLDAKTEEIRRIVNGIESQIAVLLSYRNSLIHECVTGQKRITEEDLNRVLKNG